MSAVFLLVQRTTGQAGKLLFLKRFKKDKLYICHLYLFRTGPNGFTV